MRLGVPELLIILVIILLLFGAKKVPDIANSLGRSLREFKHGMVDIDKSAAGSTPTDNAKSNQTESNSGDRLSH